MKLFLFLTKKNILIVFAAVLIVFSISAKAVLENQSQIDGATPQSRLSYIYYLGFAVEDNVSAKQTVIPTVFSEVYSNYNKIQKMAGFDLLKYKGETVTVYTYNIIESDKKINLIVHNGKVIGGDICDVSFNGEMKPLKK